jgi:hypothetical protein
LKEGKDITVFISRWKELSSTEKEKFTQKAIQFKKSKRDDFR